MASPLEMTEMYDNALLGILQHVGNIEEFLQIYFGFLYRKTDFYRLLSSPTDKLGFPPGVAEKLVLKTYKVFEKLAEHDRETRVSQLQKREEKERQSVPPAAQELEITSDTPEETEEPSQAAAQVETCSKDEAAAAAVVAEPSRTKSSCAPGQLTETEPEAEETQETFQRDSDSYNGAVRENYKWSQDYTDVEVRVFVPKTVVKGRQVSVTLHTGSVRVSVREGAEEKTLMEGEFTHKINTEDSLWSLEPGHCVVLSLNKTTEVWWNAVLKGEREIDINKIHRERAMATVDEEEHAVLDRLTFDYHQKLQGKPQSHEMKVHDMLRKGWEAEGSPFKGQPFDPSMFNIPSSAVQF